MDAEISNSLPTLLLAGSKTARIERQARVWSPVAVVLRSVATTSALWSSISRSGRVVFPTPRADRALVEFLCDRIEANELRAVVDRTYPLEAIADAYRYVETQRKTGIVVIDVA